jgi:hypothetical protein
LQVDEDVKEGFRDKDLRCNTCCVIHITTHNQITYTAVGYITFFYIICCLLFIKCEMIRADPSTTLPYLPAGNSPVMQKWCRITPIWTYPSATLTYPTAGTYPSATLTYLTAGTSPVMAKWCCITPTRTYPSTTLVVISTVTLEGAVRTMAIQTVTCKYNQLHTVFLLYLNQVLV